MNNTINKMKSFDVFINEEDYKETPSSDSVSTEDKYKVADKLNEIYEKYAVSESKEWASDPHDEHTEESYMKENAALVATLAANALKESCEHTTEQYESAVKAMGDAFNKKLNEVIEMYKEGKEGEGY